MISRDRAAEIAAAAITAKADERDRAKVRQVLSLGELDFAKPRIYNYPPETLLRYWIVYLQRPLLGLFSSEVMLISKEDGEICYWGSANDEG